MKRERTLFEFWLTWVLANAVGVGFGAVLVTATATFFFGFGVVVAWALAGAVIVVIQWNALGLRTQAVPWWPWATFAVLPTVGLAVGPAAFFVPWLFLGWAGALGSLVVIVGAVLLAQWLVLRRHLPGAGWWVLASAVAWAVGVAVVVTVFGNMMNTVNDAPGYDGVGAAIRFFPVSVSVSWAAGMAAGAAVTGIAVFWLLPQPPSVSVEQLLGRKTRLQMPSSRRS